MAKKEVEEITEDTLKKGGILAKLYFDMHSDKPEDLQPLMADLINNRLLKTPGVLYCYGTIDEPIKVKDLYTTNAAVTVLFKNLSSLINVAFNFVPAGIEILKPEDGIMLKTPELQTIVLDISQISINYMQYILSRVLTKEDYEKVMFDINNRAEQGKKLIGQKSDKPA